MIKIKICGMRSPQDAIWATSAGAWAAGFVFAPSARQVTVDEAARIIRVMPPSVHKVGVFVDSSLDTVKATAAATGIDMLQFHGQESPEYCQEFALPVIKSFRIRDENSLAQVEKYTVFACLCDTYVPDRLGGSGRTFDWRCLQGVPAGLRIILAGGLTPCNVSSAIRQISPFAVDVSSGVEINGRKDRILIKDFIKTAERIHATT
ncbi:MAG: phosphoribosylanthranilate isomerase [Syntrophomonadaceae bacterium]|nr:phosphoribosylanthranilate isomerase [Syntrophomonadaceae bacterium]